MMHATIASMLRFSLSKGAFNALDGCVSCMERLCHGKEGCRQRKRKLRRKARKVSFMLHLLSCYLSLVHTCDLSCGAVNTASTGLTSTHVVVKA